MRYEAEPRNEGKKEKASKKPKWGADKWPPRDINYQGRRQKHRPDAGRHARCFGGAPVL